MSRVSRGSAARQGGPTWAVVTSRGLNFSSKLDVREKYQPERVERRHFAIARASSLSVYIKARVNIAEKKSVAPYIKWLRARREYFISVLDRPASTNTHALAARARHSQEEVLHLLNWSLWTSVLCDKNNNKMRKYVRWEKNTFCIYQSWILLRVVIKWAASYSNIYFLGYTHKLNSNLKTKLSNFKIMIKK